MVGKDLIMATLFGSGGGSSGSGGGGGGWPEVPDDGATYVFITLQEGRTSPQLGVCVNGTVTVDWGDGTGNDVLTGTSTTSAKWTQNHAYAAPGNYVIRLTVDGEMGFTGDSYNRACILRYASGNDNRNVVYQSALRKVKIGNGVTSIAKNAFNNCCTLESVVIPDGVTSIGGSAFSTCYSLESVAIPDGVTSIGDSAFYRCYALESVVIPDGVTSIGGSAFSGCTTLASVTMPSSVTRIGSSAFYTCYGVAYYDFTSHVAVPALVDTTVFSGIPDDCVFLIPSALYDEWIAATNWTTYADRCVAK